jgi:hypothetical protein
VRAQRRTLISNVSCPFGGTRYCQLQDLQRLAAHAEELRIQSQEGLGAFVERHDLRGWESWYSPYDDGTYGIVLEAIRADDVVLDLGAGDLRLALQMAGLARRVYAVEVNPLLLATVLGEIGLDLPRNVHVICANMLDVAVPPDVTAAVLLMRHCARFRVYLDRLEASSCRRLITNARWKSGVEVIDLTRPRMPFHEVQEGWYACRCGAVGYVGEGSRPQSAAVEVFGCPSC